MRGSGGELVRHSGRVLQALTFAPTGAIVAAPTTSLPESVGGERNWDYRYTWVRDASLTMEALWVAACPDEANKFFAFLADAAASRLQRGADLQIMFGIGGERDLTERELPHLAGWRGSRPVRVGNGAWLQRQLDVYGELLGAAQRLVDQLGELDPVTRRFLAAAADTAGRPLAGEGAVRPFPPRAHTRLAPSGSGSASVLDPPGLAREDRPQSPVQLGMLRA
jgi:alpha,alpha-trehalase